ncbi:hypothetical protein N7539_005605 [Penicillium diatomitis]|uniref:SNF2 N-terminal domain-containing protein n=1 Tax=Penicillium diatomitis TaxID=2819901 RepID=A0A9W9X7B7_9EURO|nr:uncharacterized protein N7539_005605 [Penicillium diatomitis]KAJ5485617.1 hypothetical protein N7539_005605 [Penicillium diatomitis]
MEFRRLMETPDESFVSSDEDMVPGSRPSTPGVEWGPRVSCDDSQFIRDSFEDCDIPEVRRTRCGPPNRYLSLDLPPMHKLEDIYKDIAERAMRLGLGRFLKHIGKRPLRVATACSGTESPILALEMLRKALGSESAFEMSHVFSCEIVPFKQAFIERNLQPPILFRDLLELGNDEAHTAYGALVPVPGDIDILIAGTACVDFSALNHRRKLLSQEGESSSTFNALLRYAQKYRPAIVIMENVKSAPWKDFIDIWDEIGYDATYTFVDTKSYYLPHTRMRGYLVAVDKHRKTERLPGDNFVDSRPLSKRFGKSMTQFARKASSPVGKFLLPDHDRRIEQIRNDLTTRLDASTRSESSWERYKIRHAEFRADHGLGDQRPISRSLPGGLGLSPPDFYWHSWMKAQPERVIETVDMKFLYCLTKDIDSNFKERCIDLSQGVDRGTEGISSSGVVGCLTPCGMPFVTSRGGPISGLEALSLQGLPLDRIILTSESQRDLQDLAGNAMTSTTVCAAICSALIGSYPKLKKEMDVPLNARATAKEKSARIAILGDIDSNLGPMFTTDSSQFLKPDSTLLRRAMQSTQFCSCEGQSMVKDLKLLRICSHCQHRACESCAGNPTHAYRALNDNDIPRDSAVDFIAFLKSSLPMRLKLSGLAAEIFSEFSDTFPAPPVPSSAVNSKHSRTQTPGTSTSSNTDGSDSESEEESLDPETTYDGLIGAIRLALSEDVQFFDIERSHIWTVIYEGEHSSMRLEIGPSGLQWLYYVKPSPQLPARCLLREIFGKPIARLLPQIGTLLDGEWAISAPLSMPFSLMISGMGEQIPAFPAAVGIVKEPFSQMKVWTQIKVDGIIDDNVLDCDVHGIYDALPECGTAMASLYKKKNDNLYLFLDTNKISAPDQDVCVFAFDHSRLSGYDQRITVAELSPKWRATRVTSEPEEVKAFNRRWYRAPGNVTLKPSMTSTVAYRTIQSDASVRLAGNNCHLSYTPLISLTGPDCYLKLHWQAPVSTDASETLPSSWEVIALENSEFDHRSMAWAVQNVASQTDVPWNRVPISKETLPDNGTLCQTCDPPTPSIIWGRDKQGKVTPYEDPQGAAAYERAAKSKPAPFILLQRNTSIGMTELCFALNIQSLAHRAFGRLVNRVNSRSIAFYWRLVGNTNDWGRTSHPKFTLLDNSGDEEHAQPPNFRVWLRRDQRRSLSWMVKREADKISPFWEQETEEALLPLMSWRAEVRVMMPRFVRGGVLCDEVGYGKTATILGLIDVQHEVDVARSYHNSVDSGLISIKATLLVVPANVYKQWGGEITKFLGNKYKVQRLDSPKSISSASVRQMREADIILIPWPVFNNVTYYQNMRYFTGTPKVPSSAGRDFDSWFNDASQCLRQMVRILQEQGPEEYLSNLWARRFELRRTQATSTYVPSRRLRGAAFVRNLERQGATATTQAGPEKYSIARSSRISQGSFSAIFRQPISPDDRYSSDEALDEEPDCPGEVDDQEQDGRKGKRKIAKQKKIKQPPKARVKKATAWSDDRKMFNIPAPHANCIPSMEDMTGLPLHAFHFNRVVLDEYTYSRDERIEPILSLGARSKWILSGTPALDEFTDIKDIAAHLGVHLGIDNDGDQPTSNSRLKTTRRKLTAREAFEMHEPPRSMAWYEKRRKLAQGFLDQFARQNTTDVSELSMACHLIVNDIPEPESKLYRALYDHLHQTQGIICKIPGSTLGATETAINAVLTKSKSPDEALLKSLLADDILDHALSERSCEKGFNASTRASIETWKKLEVVIKMTLLSIIGQNDHVSEGHFNMFVNLSADPHTQRDVARFVEKVGDHLTGTMVNDALDRILSNFQEWIAGPEGEELRAKLEDKMGNIRPTEKQEAQLRRSFGLQPASASPGTVTDDNEYLEQLRFWQAKRVLKILLSDAWKLVQRLVESNRDVRFWECVREIRGEHGRHCDRCFTVSLAREELTILRKCGHCLCPGCLALVNEPANSSPACVVPMCRAAAGQASQVSGRSVDDTRAVHENSKLASMVDIIRAVPDDEKVVLFVQFEDAMAQASRALTAAGIQHCVGRSAKVNGFTDFLNPRTIPVSQQGPGQAEITRPDAGGQNKRKRGGKTAVMGNKTAGPKVLILRLGSVMAAGLNLQVANHVLFLSPLLAPTQHDYDASMTQAIGRCRRFGQQRTVHVYHLLARGTVEVNIFEQRTASAVVVRGSQVLQVQPSEVQPFDGMCSGQTPDF